MKTKPTMGRKLIAWILTLAMVITFIPMTGNTAYAGTATIATDKAVYEVGEPIMVTTTGYADGEWVAIYDASVTGAQFASSNPSYYWYYPTAETVNIWTTTCSNIGGNPGGMNNYLPEGEYRVLLLAQVGDQYVVKAEKEVTITTPVNKEKLTLDKTEYSIDEDVIVTLNSSCGDSDWVALYTEGKGPWSNGAYSSYYYPGTENKVYNLGKLAQGKYTLYFLENDGYNVLDCVQFTVKVETTVDPDPDTPVNPPEESEKNTFVELYTSEDATTATDEFAYNAAGTPIYVRANNEESGEDRPWIGLYRGELTTSTWSQDHISISWAYAEKSEGTGQPNAYNGEKAYDITTNTQGYQGGFDSKLIPGTYTVILFKNYNSYGPVAAKTFTVTGDIDLDMELVPEEHLETPITTGGRDYYDLYTAGFPQGINVKITGEDAFKEVKVGICVEYETNPNLALAYKNITGLNGQIDITDGWTDVDANNGQYKAGTRKLMLVIDGMIADEKYIYVRPNASDAKVNLSATEFTYNGQAQKPGVTSVDGYNSNWYVVEFPENPVNAGTYTVKAKFHGNVGGTATATYTINPAAITADMVNAVIADQTYVKDSTATPEVVVAEPLVKGTDYTVTYKNNDKPGVATAVVKGQGNYTGTVEVNFNIVCAHNYETVVTEPTCEAGGYTTDTCTVCGDTKVYDEKDALNHAWDDGVVTTPVTCTANGEMTYTCQRDANHTKTEPIVTEGHSMTHYPAVDATCTEAGNYEHYICGNCDKYFQKPDGSIGATANSVVIPATGEHDMTEVAEVAATCEDTGFAAHYVCGTCEGLFVIEEDEYVKKEEADLTIEALDHNYAGTVTTEPTCTEKGVKTFVCQNDAKHTYTKDVAALGHTMKATAAVAATCETAGNTAYFTCETCKGYFADEAGKTATTAEAVVVKALGHKYDAGTVTKAATCTEDGVKTFVCQNDAKHTKTEAVKATGHKYTEAVTAPTCTAEGFTTFTCACGHTYKDAVTPVAEHTVVVDEAVAPTYTATGLTEGTHCSVCETVLTAQEEVAGLVPATAKNVKVNLRTVTGGYDDIKVTWNKVTGAKSYKVFWKKAAAKKWNVANVKTNSFTKANLDDGVKYQVKVVAVGTFGESKTSAVFSTTTLKKLNAPKVTKSGAKVKVKWNNINGETGYQISRAAKKGGTNVIATVKNANAVSKIVKANKGTKYFYKVRAYKVVNGTKVFGPWSAVKAFKR